MFHTMKNNMFNITQNSNDQKQGDKLDEWYTFPADIKQAELHKNAFKFGKTRLMEQKCKCCGYYKVDETYSVFCGSPWEKTQNEDPNASKKEGWITQCRMPSGVLVYLTFIKGVLLFLAFRFFIFDIWTAIISNDGSFCSELFRTKEKDLCLYTISGYNLKSTANKIGLHALDYFNAALTAFSLVYFVCFKKYLETKRSVIEMEDIEEDHYAIMVDNIPNSFLKGKTLLQIIQTVKSKEQYIQKLQKTFLQKIQQWARTIGHTLKEQYDFLMIHIPPNSIPDQCKKELQRYVKQDQYTRSVNSIFKVMDLKIITQTTLCYDISEIETLEENKNGLICFIQEMTSFKQFSQNYNEDEGTIKANVILKKIRQYNQTEVLVQKKYAASKEIDFHLTHFTGKAIISFQYKYFRDYILNEYEKDPDFLQIDGHSLSLSLPGKPTDIYWNNMKVPNQQRAKYHIYTWVVLVTMLILAFGIILVLQLWKKGEEVVLENQSTWDKMERFAVTALSGLITALINYFLSEVIQIMAKSEKHITKSNQVSSLIVKSTVAQTLNTLFIYLFIYFMKPSNPLGPYGLVSKVVGAAIVTAAITPVLEIIQPAKLLKSFQNLAFTKNEKAHQKFQIELNREMQYTAFNKDNMYVYYILLTFWVSFYGFLSPLVPLLIIGLFAFQYWVDKCKIFYWSSPLVFKDDMVENIMTLLQFSVVLSSASYFAWDMSINYSEGLHLKPLNLICVVIALYYSGFEFFVKKSVKDRLLSNNNEDLKSYQQQKSYYQNFYLHQNQMTYVNQNPATKHLNLHQHNSKKIKEKFTFSLSSLSNLQSQNMPNKLKCCSECNQSLSLQNEETTSCRHFYFQLSPQNCPVCICGWSDSNNHSCKNLKSVANLKLANLVSDQLKASSKFIRLLYGFLQMLLIPLATILLLIQITLFIGLLTGIISIVMPFLVLYSAFQLVFLCERGTDNKYVTVLFCFPCIFLKGIFVKIPQGIEQMTKNYSLSSYIKNKIMHVKQLFYTINPYKENILNYSRIAVESATRRKVYFSLMAVLLPVMFALAAAYYVASIAVVLAFTVVFCPFIVLKEKYVPFWIIIAFYPVVLCTYLFSEYSSFVWNQTKELMTFYGNYIGTMCCYLFNKCSGENQLENRFQLPAEEPQN